MPLRPGRSRKVIAANIRDLEHSQSAAGRKRNAQPNAHKINIAIAMREARRKKKKRKS